MTVIPDIIPFSQDHLDGALALSREAGWPHRREDWDMLRRLSHGFAAVKDGQILGTIFATPLDDTMATINMVIVSAALRGQGIGKRLMAEALDAVGSRGCSMVATREGLPLYEKLGFRRIGEIVQHQGTVTVPVTADARSGSGVVTWAGAVDVPALQSLDHRALGLSRTPVIEALVGDGRFAVLRRDGALAGYACLRPFGRGEVAGPVVAASVEDARTLLSFLFAPRAGAFVRVDTDADSGLADWLAEWGLTHAGGGTRMIRSGSAVSPITTQASTPGPRVYALASQALG